MDINKWIDQLDDELVLDKNEFGFTVPEEVENHNASFQFLKAGLNKLTKSLRAVN